MAINHKEEIEKIVEETRDDGWTLTSFDYDEEAEDEFGEEISNTKKFLQELKYNYEKEADPSALTKYVHEEELYHNMDYDSPIHCTNLGRLSVDPNYLQKQLQLSLEKVMDDASFALISTHLTKGYRGHRCLYGKGIIHTKKCSIPVTWEMLYDEYFKGMVWI